MFTYYLYWISFSPKLRSNSRNFRVDSSQARTHFYSGGTTSTQWRIRTPPTENKEETTREISIKHDVVVHIYIFFSDAPPIYLELPWNSRREKVPEAREIWNAPTSGRWLSLTFDRDGFTKETRRVVSKQTLRQNRKRQRQRTFNSALVSAYKKNLCNLEKKPRVANQTENDSNMHKCINFFNPSSHVS